MSHVSFLLRNRSLRSVSLRHRHLLARQFSRSPTDEWKLMKRYFSTERKASQERIGRTLYRGLLRWCQGTSEDIPLDSFVPPVHLAPDSVGESGLQALVSISSETSVAQSSDEKHRRLGFIRDLLPSQSIAESHQLTVPIHNSSDVRGLLRAVFRLGKESPADANLTNKRTSTAFETLKSLNELTAALEDLKRRREDHLDRTGVSFSVGQVVQHKSDRWRGVIIDWRRTKTNDTVSADVESPTSLTQKDYTPLVTVAKEQDDVEYSLVLDMGDAHLLGGVRKTHDESSIAVAMQSDLESVSDDSLCRVRSNWVPTHFGRFDTERSSFVPNATKGYAYPSDDHFQRSNARTVPEDHIKAGEQVVQGVQEFASKLERDILDASPGEASGGLRLLASYRQRLASLSTGDVLSTRDILSPVSLSSVALAIKHLQNLLSIALEVSETVWQRRVSEISKTGIKYSLGDIVQHKKYGFRGVVVAWDPKPTVDVTRWDGLTEVENPMELPFYHVIPDQNDCVLAFGGERPFRYVCEANLEKCPESMTVLEVDLGPEWNFNASESCYVPPDDLKFKYAEELGLDSVATSCMTAIKDEVNRFHVALRDSTSNATTVEEKMSMKNLFILLQAADCMEDAVVVEETIKEIWKAHTDPQLRWRLDDGIADLLNGKKEQALNMFSELVQDDPQYAEAWNKKSTCHFMLGDMTSSLETANRALELQPMHFQALNGLGLVQYETRKYGMSAESFRRSIRLDPWSPVSSRLLVCLDVLKTMGMEEEGASEGSAPYET